MRMSWPRAFRMQISITPRRGDYRLMNTAAGAKFAHTMFQAPTEAGKGVLVSPTVHGNLLVGPNAVEQEDKDAAATRREGLDFIFDAARKTFPGLDPHTQYGEFRGRARDGRYGRFRHRRSAGCAWILQCGVFRFAWIDVGARRCRRHGAAHRSVRGRVAQGIIRPRGEDAAAILGARRPRPRRRHRRRSACRPACVLQEDQRSGRGGSCWLHSRIPVLCLDAVKWRTEAMMGGCNGGFCVPEIANRGVRAGGFSR